MSPYVDTLSETVRDRATLNKRAHQIMSRHCVTVRLGTSVETAGYMLIEKKISCLPVVDKNWARRRHYKLEGRPAILSAEQVLDTAASDVQNISGAKPH